MPGVDWIPGISQLKATCQLLTGDVDGFATTMENFLKECPGVSQLTSVAQLAGGDVKGALDTQKRCLGTINNVANGIPVVGHVKAIIHGAAGDKEGCTEALNAATRSLFVITSGAAAGLATGGLGAIPAGIAAGGAYDITTTIASEKPQGIVAALGNVAKNPSAGPIFDTAACFAGDGLAGYSGYQMCNKSVIAEKIDHLETVRDTKMQQLENVLFDGADMTSKDLHNLGTEIKILTNEINNMKQTTPQYYFDLKTRKVVVEYPTEGQTVVPIIGYVDQINKIDKTRKKEILTEIYQNQENSLLSDDYVEDMTDHQSKESKEKCLLKFKHQETGRKGLHQVYPNVAFRTKEQLNQMKQQFERNDPNNKLKQFLTSNSWLHVRMPQQFNYTGGILVNSWSQGLLHTYFRHGDQWSDFIENIDRIIDEFPDLEQALRRVRNARNPRESGTALTNLDNVLRQLDNDTSVAVHTALHEIQMRIHQTLQENITYQNYLGEGINVHGKQQVFFKVTDRNGNTRVMAVCVSNELYENGFSVDRPTRTVTTVFFISWEDYLKRYVGRNF